MMNLKERQKSENSGNAKRLINRAPGVARLTLSPKTVDRINNLFATDIPLRNSNESETDSDDDTSVVAESDAQFQEHNLTVTADIHMQAPEDLPDEESTESESQWTIKQSKKRTLTRSHELGKVNKAPRMTRSANESNYYEILSENLENNIDSSGNTYNFKAVDLSTSNYNKNNSFKASGKKVVNEKSKFCPPIILFNAEIKDVRRVMNTYYKDTIYRIVLTKNNTCKLFVDNPITHKRFFEVIKKTNQLKGYTFTPKQNKVTTLLLKGISSEFSPEEILQELNQIAPNTKINAVKRFTTNHAKENDIVLDMFIVQIPPEENIEEIISIKGMLNQRTRWERIRTNGMIQCKRCQRFGHVASNCNIEYRCVKCANKHGPKECTKKDKKDPAFCINCQSYGHPASYKRCPKYLEILNNRRDRIMEARARRESNAAFVHHSINNYRNKDKTFADCFKNNTTNFNTGNLLNEPNTNEFINMSRDLFGISLTELIAKINQFIPRFSALNTLEEKQSSYFEFFFGLCTTRHGRV